MKIHYLLLVPLFLVAFGGTSIGQMVVSDENTSTSPQVISEITDKMSLLRSAILNRDTLMLADLLAEDVTYGHSNGLIQTKVEVISSISSGSHSYFKIESRELKVRAYNDAAVVNMTADVSMLLDGKPLELDMKILFLWVKDDKQWKLAARQSVRTG